MTKIKNPIDTTGHRARLREKFLKSSVSLHDYEVVELILCMAQPRLDVKPIAKDLIRRFGNFAAIISASEANLAAVPGISTASICALKLVQEAASRLLTPAKERILLNSSKKVLEYCQSMSYNETEQFRVLYLDSKNALIKDETQSYGTINQTPLYPRELLKAAMNLGAAGLIISHNHPSGDPSPSRADVALTTQIRNLMQSVGIQLHDHIIVARGRSFSFRKEGILGLEVEV
jgi:DNA repair protein RadC